MTLIEDTLLEERYRIDNLIAHGGMSSVYKAFDVNLQVPVALKENYFHTPDAVEQFKKEAFLLAKLRHSALPRVLQHFSHEGYQYLVMEFIDGMNLWEMVKEQGGPFSEIQSLKWIYEICNAASYLHNQSPPVIHRDIKPQNIKVMSNGQVVLVDFGIAKEGSCQKRTATGARGVTPGFSPPEQYSGGRSGPKSDIYALGATLYALLTAVRPPDSVSLAIGEEKYVPPDKLNKYINKDISAAISWAMRPKPTDRPTSVEEWKGKLLSIYKEGDLQVSVKGPAKKSVEKPAVKKQEGISKEPSPPKKKAAKPAPHSKQQPAKTEGITCPLCGCINREDVRFCEDCGKEIKSEKPAVKEAKKPPRKSTAQKNSVKDKVVCPSCGAKNRSNMRFCEDCGKEIKSEKPAVKKAKKPPRKPTAQIKVVKDDVVCPSCGSKNNLKNRFCEDCGVELLKKKPTEKRKCPNCGAEMPGQMKFCEDCGTKIV